MKSWSREWIQLLKMKHEIMIKEVKSTSKDGTLSKENRWNHDNCDHCHHEWDKNRMNNNNSKKESGLGQKWKRMKQAKSVCE